MTNRTEASRPRRLRTVLFVCLGIVAIVVIAAAWVGVRALMAKAELDAIVPLVDDVKSAASDRDLNRIDTLASELADHGERATALSSDPVWRTAEAVPWLGPNLAAVRIASAQLDQMSRKVVQPLVKVAQQEQKGLSGGSLDIAGISAAVKPLAVAASTTHRAARDLAAIDTDALIAPLASGIHRLSTVVDSADATLGSLSKVATVVPGLVGADGPRTLLLVIQNNAELRTGGGITGTFIQVRVADGRLALTGIADSSQFRRRDASIIPVPASLTSLYGDVAGRFVQDASIPADFDLTGRLVSAWWASRAGTAPDAVVSIDPLVLKSLLSVTGPVVLPDGSALTAGNLVKRLLVDPYMTMTTEQQTAFFAEATSAMFARLFGKGLDPLAWVQALQGPVREGRISVWSADASEQKQLTATVLGGPAVRQTLAGKDAYAVYFNDRDGGKMGTFLKTSISAGTAQCRQDGARTVGIEVSLTSTAPADAASLPVSMTGGGLYGAKAGDIGLIVSVSAPKKAFFGGVFLDGKPIPSTNVVDGDFAVSAAHVDLPPGRTGVLQFRFTLEKAREPVILHTPLVNDPRIRTATPTCG